VQYSYRTSSQATPSQASTSRHANLVGQVHWPPNPALQRTPLRVEQDPSDFERQNRLQWHLSLFLAAPLSANPLGRAVPSHVWLLVSMAICTRHAHFQTPRQRACPHKRNAGAACPNRFWLVVVSAHSDEAPAKHARITTMPSTR